MFEERFYHILEAGDRITFHVKRADAVLDAKLIWPGGEPVGGLDRTVDGEPKKIHDKRYAEIQEDRKKAKKYDELAAMGDLDHPSVHMTLRDTKRLREGTQ